MKFKDLLTGRDKLRKYDELKEWREYFSVNRVLINTEGSSYCRPRTRETVYGNFVVIDELPANIKQIIIGAIDAEIKKMEEELYEPTN